MKDAERAIGWSRVKGSRTLTVSILVSLALHGVLIALLLWVIYGGPRGTVVRVIPRSDAAFAVTLLSPEALGRSEAVRASTAASPAIEAPVPAPVGILVKPPGESVGRSLQPQLRIPETGDAAASGTETRLAQPASVDAGMATDYRQRLLAHILAYRQPADAAAGQRIKGVAMVRIALGRGGRVLWVELAASSGSSDLDDEAVATIWRARPMPPIPPGLPDSLSVVLPVAPSNRPTN